MTISTRLADTWSDVLLNANHRGRVGMRLLALAVSLWVAGAGTPVRAERLPIRI